MATVTYKSVSGKGFIFPVTVSDVEHWVEINPVFTTSNTGIQSAIELKKQYTSGKVVKSGNYATNLKAVITDDVDGASILTSEIKTAGGDYVVGDVLTFASDGGGKDAIIKITEVDEDGGVAAYEVVESGTKFTTGDKAISQSTSTAGTLFALKVLTITPAKVYPEESPFSYTQYPDVTNFSKAKEVLRNEPYNVAFQKLRTPEMVMIQAKQHSVEFPNWTI